MSRSNPHENGTPNPAVRWFDWHGEHGTIRYYDKDTKQTIDVGSEFTFLLLDQLGSVRGWHDASESGIYSNEVKDTRTGVLVVKAFKGGTLAEGLYKDIKDRVSTLGGQFVANCYIAFRRSDDDGALSIGSLRFKGAALRAWMDFTKAHRAELYKKAIGIRGFTEGKKGRIVYRVPTFRLLDTTPQTDREATALDAILQEFLQGYFARTTKDQVDDARHISDEDVASADASEPAAPRTLEQLSDDEIPF